MGRPLALPVLCGLLALHCVFPRGKCGPLRIIEQAAGVARAPGVEWGCEEANREPEAPIPFLFHHLQVLPRWVESQHAE